ncbi:hypothetical protein ABT336_11990 [Micromonospora sp. NPDC000207]|uniref:hypothetical protein n=1 Tax=Micromonospora sp. NPDC000207 TaxID=3154246 RepID=UPI00333496B4
MADPTDVTLPITPRQIQRAVEHIVEQVHPRPRGEKTMPMGEMERRLAAYAGDLVHAALAAAGTAIAPDARDRLARYLWIADAGDARMWDRRGVDRTAWLAKADMLLDSITGRHPADG